MTVRLPDLAHQQASKALRGKYRPKAFSDPYTGHLSTCLTCLRKHMLKARIKRKMEKASRKVNAR